MKSKLEQIKKINWKKGGSLVEFAIILPSICFILFAIIVIAQLCLCRQSLEHTAYLSARAAVVCETYDDAVKQMNAVALESIKSSVFGVDESGIKTNLALVAGTSGAAASDDTVNGITWEKGALAEITITVPLNKAFPIGPDVMTAKIYLMVERPAATYS